MFATLPAGTRFQKVLVTQAHFLYIITALLKTGSYSDLHNIFFSHYLRPQTERYGEETFDRFDRFYAHSDILNDVLAPEGRRLYSPAAELIKRQAQREDLPLAEILQADLLILLLAFIMPDTRWFPQILYYASYGNEFSFFIRAAQHKNFKKLAIITGIDNADTLRSAVKEGFTRLQVVQWHGFHFEKNFWKMMNMDKLDTIQ